MTVLELATAAGRRTVRLGDYLDASSDERAQEDSLAWIKALRTARVDGDSFRRRFTVRGDSLWWFAEIYLHKTQTVLQIIRTIAALDALIERERPQTIRSVEGPHRLIEPVARARGISLVNAAPADTVERAVVGLERRARSLTLAARLSRLRGHARSKARARVAAFVHRAFWRADAGEGSAESYIGPVLQEIERQLGADGVTYIGVGPRHNFRARRWWKAFLPQHAGSMVPIERYASRPALRASEEIWNQRHDVRNALWSSDDIRAHATIRGCDFWDVVREELAGVALLQFPWSVRSMDEAAAALQAVEPEAAVTYAEAGGWGRALALECRRAGVPLAGIQHGFIYRHWLNYRHEQDEMLPDPRNVKDRGFPRPARTLLFDDYAARHLLDAGRFPADSIEVTGSARLDDLVAAVTRQTPQDISATREATGTRAGQALIVFAAKHKEAAPYLARLVNAVDAMPNVRMAIKPHPAETADVYSVASKSTGNTCVVAPGYSLPRLLAAARCLVTVNSTVAIDALSVGVPSLVIGLPNNLTPFVDAGVLAGAGSEEEVRTLLGRLLYDEEFRRQLGRASEDFLRRNRPTREGGAAARAAASVIALADARRDRAFSSIEGI